MIISTGTSRKDTHWCREELSWDELLRRLSRPVYTQETVDQYAAMSVDQQSEIKDVGGFVGGELYGQRRRADQVKSRCLVTLDADHVKAGDDLFFEYQWLWTDRCCVYSTHKHRPEAPRLRFVIPLKRTVTAEEYEPIARKLAERIGINCMDVTTYEPCRLMYWPSCSRDGEYIYKVCDGDVVDPDEVLAEYGPGDAWRDASLWPIGSEEETAHVRESREAGAPEDKPGTIGLFCRTYDVHTAIAEWLSDVYAPVDGDERRYTYLAGSTSGGAVVYGNGSWLYSHHSTDPCGDGHLYNAYDLVRVHRFGGDDKAMQSWVDTLPEVRKTLIDERRGEMADLTDMDADEVEMVVSIHDTEEMVVSGYDIGICGGGDGDTATAISASVTEIIVPARDGEDWERRLTVNTKTKEVRPEPENVRLIVENDPAIRGKIGRNIFTARPAIKGIVPWRNTPKQIEEMQETWLGGGDVAFKDSDAAGLRWYIGKTYGIRSAPLVADALEMVLADPEYKFHPVRDYLDGLRWDGVERLDTMLVRWMGAKDTPLNRTMTRKWAVGAVRRIYEPGCKFDNMLVLVGPKGIGKSRFARVLSHEPHGRWFTDSLGSTKLTEKESFVVLLGKWIVEVGELSSFVKSELEDVKRFVAASSDYYRQPYATYAEDVPRQCVFIGSTNTTEFIKDQAGERRFWPVLCAGVNNGWHVGLEEEVDMLWAEAKYRMEHGEVSALTDSEQADALAEVQLYFTQVDDLREELRAYLDTPLPRDWAEWDEDKRRRWFDGSTLREGVETPMRRNVVTRNDIRLEFFHGSAASSSSRYDVKSKQISDMMETLTGWKKAEGTRRIYGVPSGYYYRVGTEKEDWPVAEV